MLAVLPIVLPGEVTEEQVHVHGAILVSCEVAEACFNEPVVVLVKDKDASLKVQTLCVVVVLCVTSVWKDTVEDGRTSSDSVTYLRAVL